MKKIVLSLAVLALSYSAQAQENPTYGFNEGDVMVEGSLQVTTKDNKNTEVKTSEFVFNPKAGYFLSDKFAVGVELGIGTDKTENYGTIAPLSQISQKGNSFYVGAFGRYYFLDLGSRFKTYAEVGVGHSTSKSEEEILLVDGSSRTTEDPKVNTVGFNAGLGFSYFVTPKIAINFGLTDILSYNSSKSKADGAKASNEFNANINNFSNFFDAATFGLTFKF